MGPYAYSNVLLMERTIRMTCTTTATVGDAQAIPTITVGGVTYRPLGYAIVAASGDFDLTVGIATSLGSDNTITAASVSTSNPLSMALGLDDLLILSDGAGTTTVDIRWFWTTQARDGIGVGISYGTIIPLQTMTVNAVAAEAFLEIPTGAVELVLYAISANSLSYRVDGELTSETIVPDLQFVNAFGNQVDVLSAGGNLPAWLAGDYLAITGHPSSNNNGIYQVSSVNTSTEDYTIDKIDPLDPSDYGIRSTSVWSVVDGQAILVGSAAATLSSPFSIYVNDGDRLRIQRSGGADVKLDGYWRIAR